MDKTTRQSLKDVKAVDELKSYLELKGGNHKYYHHYTSFETLLKILESKFFLLTRGDSLSMNDQHEWQSKGSVEVWERTYMSCFSYGENEIMAMWGLYCLPWEEGVRISIPRKAMLEWIKNIQEVYLVSLNPFIREQIYPLPNITLADIIYIDGDHQDLHSKLYRSGESVNVSEVNLVGVDEDPKMTGFIKNAAWQYENEVRLVIQLQDYNTCEKIGIKIPDFIIKSMIITAGPYFKEDLQQQLAESYNGRLDCRNSQFKNLVNYRSLCSLCQKEPFLKKDKQ